ncbi:MAG: SH3 domain-containing protein [Desulfobulbaceae bacterium]|nr:SH3 domain-containing protein [Desulfobulbaceae bacterium]
MKQFRFKKVLAGMLIVPAFSLMTAATGVAADYVSVLNDNVNLRSGPDTKHGILYELPSGFPLKVLSREGQWIKVSDFENDQGWIYAPLVSDAQYCIVTVNEGNLRAGPGVNHDKVGTVVREVILRKIKTEGDWIQVEHPRLKGWIHKKLVWP